MTKFIGMDGKARLRLVPHLVIGGLLVGHLVEIVFDREHWPLSSYPMYSKVAQDRGVHAYRLVGIARASKQEFGLQAYNYLHPFDQARLPSALEDIWTEASTKHLVDHALGDVLRRYELRRQRGEHAGPELERLRLYRTYHEPDPWARNLKTPSRRLLLAEVQPTTPATPAAAVGAPAARRGDETHMRADPAEAVP